MLTLNPTTKQPNTKLKKTGLKLVKRWSSNDVTEVFSTCSCPLDGNLSCTDPKDDGNRGFTVIKGKYDNKETFGFYYKHGADDGLGFPKARQTIAPLVVPEFAIDSFFKKWNDAR